MSKSILFSMNGVAIMKMIRRTNARSSSGVILSSPTREDWNLEENLLIVNTANYQNCCRLRSSVRPPKKTQSQNFHTEQSWIEYSQ